ncbi:MAG TPA: cache domain-containing protein [Candidatus Baltobacteraceae bacterium]|jgi:methyl-accepting chemotaxis protein|nr:cache domain-containing protein [Candidatus Baltobacteraceae bacterium]
MYKRLVALLFIVLLCAGNARAAAPFQINGEIGLSALIALSDSRMQSLASTLEAIAESPSVQTARWSSIQRPLREVAALGIPGVLLFAAPDGTYWTLSGGKMTANIADRPYFKQAMSGRVSIGDLVTSRSSGKAQTMIAVPVRSAGERVVGVLAGSIFLDDLSAQLKRELGIGPNVIFWAIDGTGKIAIHSDATNVFVEPRKMSPALAKVGDEMLANDSGTMTYSFRGAQRSIVFRKSSVSGWRYGFGVVTGR